MNQPDLFDAIKAHPVQAASLVLICCLLSFILGSGWGSVCAINEQIDKDIARKCK